MRKPFTKKRWRLLIIIYGALDVFQEIIDLGFTEFFGIPEIANEFIDIAAGISQIIIFWYGKAITLKTATGLVITFLVEGATAGGAPCWFMEVMYAQRNAPPSEEEVSTGVVVGQQQQIAPANINRVRLPDNNQQKPLNLKENGQNVRPPGPSTREEPQFSIKDTDETLAG